MSQRRCAYCGEPIKKFIVGWIHDNEWINFGLPQHLHIAKPADFKSAASSPPG